jgi:hypothetical protein
MIFFTSKNIDDSFFPSIKEKAPRFSALALGGGWTRAAGLRRQEYHYGGHPTIIMTPQQITCPVVAIFGSCNERIQHMR